MVVTAAYLTTVAASGCGPSANNHDTDGSVDAASGGAQGTGGTRGAGSGGATAAGGATNSGGTFATGGATSSGGVFGSGGATASGGARASGGASGTGGSAGAAGAGSGDASGVISAGVRWVNRVDLSNPDRPRFSWSGSGFVARFTGTSLSLQINSSSAFIFKTVVDDVPRAAFTVAGGQQTVTLATGLAAGMHTVALYRQTEGSQGDSQFLALTVGGGALTTPPPPPPRLLEIVGDSISAGYGNLGALGDTDCYPTESHWDTYGAVAARALQAEVNTIAVSGQGAYRDYDGVTTNPAATTYTRALTNDATPPWTFGAQPQAVIVNLGTNDISNNKGDPSTPFRTAYTNLLQLIRSKRPAARIICIVGPLLSGTELSTISGHIRAAVAARVSAGDANVEFFEQIAAQTSDKAACQYHPNVAENQLMADLLVAQLKLRLGW